MEVVGLIAIGIMVLVIGALLLAGVLDDFDDLI